MKTIYQQLRDKFIEAIAKVTPPESGPVDPLLRETQDKAFGDYQSNVAMGLAKTLKRKPREIAEAIIAAADLQALATSVDIAGPGFINIRLSAAAIAQSLTAAAADERLGVAKAATPVPHLMDFSSPNLAKEMHVGHLRTTITGEVLARILEFVGHPVERVNHVGDWGTQFGMLLEYIWQQHPQVLARPDEFHVADLETFYKAAKKLFDEDETFAQAARQKVVLLQSGDATALKVWRAFLKESLRHCHEIYDWLDVRLNDVGESFYNDRLGPVVAEIRAKGLAVEDQGALCVFLEGFQGRDGTPMPFIIRKSDGGYNYASTDLAAMKYRIFERGARRIIIITDIRQAQHFAMLFDLSLQMGWTAGGVELSHIGYGMVLGADKKPFKTRSGDTVRLKDLVEESIRRSREIILKNAEGEGKRQFSEAEVEDIARAVGIAAIKYFDLSHNLASDYVFSWENMLAMDGNTGPYMLYAYARIQSVARKGGVDFEHLGSARLLLEHPTEIELAKTLSRLPDVIADVSRELKPNYLTEYLYAVSKAFNAFYDKKQGVKILDAATKELRESRLLLSHLTARTLKLGLTLLSIRTVDAM